MTAEKPKMIEMPDSIKEGLPEDREVGSVATRGIVSLPARDVVSRPFSAGRYNNAPVPHEKGEGTPIDFPGHDAHSLQARSAGDTTGNIERPTEHDPDEV